MPTIKCRACNTSMIIDRCESSQHARTCWHQCPLCKQVRLTSEREQGISEKFLDEEQYGVDPEYQLAH